MTVQVRYGPDGGTHNNSENIRFSAVQIGEAAIKEKKGWPP